MPPCCGSGRKSAYCPWCGARLAEPPPLEGLPAHCRAQARHTEAAVALWDEPGDAVPMTPARLAMQARDRARLARWRSWADGLAALLSNGILTCTQGVPTPPPPNDA